MIVMIDNYDSFTYNLVQYLCELNEEVLVFRNDATTPEQIEELAPLAIFLSPGPKGPEHAGICVEIVRRLHSRIPIFGVCLGHQAIGYAFGARIVKARRLMHGKVSSIEHDGRGVFQGVPNPFHATRYHSLAIDEKSLTASVLEVSARAEDGEIMGIRHKRYPVEGVQFHPESILTKEGKGILSNFLRIAKSFRGEK